MLVCPDCGNDQFTARAYVSVEYTLTVTEDQAFRECESPRIVDSGYDEIAHVTCDNCFTDFDPQDLVTEEHYENPLED